MKYYITCVQKRISPSGIYEDEERLRELVFCKDCHWHYGTICRRNNTMFWEDEDFCSLAERKDNETE